MNWEGVEVDWMEIGRLRRKNKVNRVRSILYDLKTHPIWNGDSKLRKCGNWIGQQFLLKGFIAPRSSNQPCVAFAPLSSFLPDIIICIWVHSLSPVMLRIWQ